MPCSSCWQIECSLLFFLSTNPSPALLLREESSVICYLTVGSRQVHKQKENRFAEPARLTKKKALHSSGYVLEIARSPFGIFQGIIRNLRHQKSLKKVKNCKKVKVKVFLISRWSTGEDCLPYLADGLKSRVRH